MGRGFFTNTEAPAQCAVGNIRGGEEHALFFFSSRRRHTRLQGDWSSDVCSSDLCKPDGADTGNGGAMTEKEQFLGTWEREVPTTLKVLKAYPAAKADLKPHSKEIGRASCRERV